MNIKKKVEEIVEKLTSDKDLKKKFEKNPAKVLEDLIGVELPDEQVNQLVEAIQAQLTVESIGGFLGGLFGKDNDKK